MIWGAVGPVLPRDRIPHITILRGFALLGVVRINFQGMINRGDSPSSVHHLTVRLLDAVVLWKFFRPFAFLFGLGIVPPTRHPASFD